MATDKTPPHKRIARAEKSAAEWKQKATLRREENEHIKNQLKSMEKPLVQLDDGLTALKKELDTLRKENTTLSKLLEKANLTIANQQQEFTMYKKKPFVRGF